MGGMFPRTVAVLIVGAENNAPAFVDATSPIRTTVVPLLLKFVSAPVERPTVVFSVKPGVAAGDALFSCADDVLAVQPIVGAAPDRASSFAPVPLRA